MIIWNTAVEVLAFIDWCYGKENDPDFGNVSRFMQDNVSRRPAVGGPARWPSFDAIKTINLYHGYMPANELDAAIAAFRAFRGYA